MSKKAAFSFIEVLVAISILAGGLFFLIRYFPAALTKVSQSENQQMLLNARSKIDSIIQGRSFNEVFLATQKRQTVNLSPTIKATLSPSLIKDITNIPLNEFSGSFFPIDITLSLQNGSSTTFTTIKNK